MILPKFPTFDIIFVIRCCHGNVLLLVEHSELTKQLQSLPIRCDTLRVQQKRTNLENKLAEVDDAIRIFSRPKVFVKLAT